MDALLKHAAAELDGPVKLGGEWVLPKSTAGSRQSTGGSSGEQGKGGQGPHTASLYALFAADGDEGGGSAAGLM